MKYFIILNIPDYWSVALRSTTLQLMNVEGQWNANLFQVLLWKISSIPIHQSLRIYGTYFTCAFNSYCLKFFIGMCVCVWGVRDGLLMPMWVHLETRVRCHMSYPAPLHLVPLRYSISLTLKLGWWTVNPSGLPVNCYIWFFPLFRFYL